jgi:hypothetical protein
MMVITAAGLDTEERKPAACGVTRVRVIPYANGAEGRLEGRGGI